MKISILGTGGWGTAIALKLHQKNYEIYMWSAFEAEVENLCSSRVNPLLPDVKIPDDIVITNSLENAVEKSELIVIAVPSHIVKGVCEKLKAFASLPMIVSVSKGFEEESERLLSDVISKTLNTDKVVILSGPTHAEEVAKDIPTAIVSACKNETYAQYIQNIFMSPTLRVYTNTDVVGVEVSGALKNVIALCAGISDGCGFGDNTKAALMTRGLGEIARLGIAMGGKPETFMGLTGVGDLIVTCTSMHSRNRRAGILIGQGKSCEEATDEVKMVVEGVKSCKSAYKLAKKYNIDMPIIETAYNILFNNQNPKDSVKMLMVRDKKAE
jgi:glycerol-3-phosphate dehydrogenase (NAD(P)+)